MRMQRWARGPHIGLGGQKNSFGVVGRGAEMDPELVGSVGTLQGSSRSLESGIDQVLPGVQEARYCESERKRTSERFVIP